MKWKHPGMFKGKQGGWCGSNGVREKQVKKGQLTRSETI